MIAFRVEIRCDGAYENCHVVFARGLPFVDLEEAGRRAESLDEAARLAGGWVRDGDAHFCPSCQCRRGGPVIDVIGIHAVESGGGA
jgi:hypothetical protein